MAEIRARFKLGEATEQQRVEQESPDVAKAAAELHALSQRFKLGLSYADCVRAVRGGGHVAAK